MIQTEKLFSTEVIRFLNRLHPEFNIPGNITVLNPYSSSDVRNIVRKFYTRYYRSRKQRIFIFGINPGRFGAGITGIPFTDPVELSRKAGIPHPFALKAELSSQFIYEAIHAYGDLTSFSKKFFLTSICPLGFVSNGKNINYYDDKILEKRARPFILKSMREQIQAGAHHKVAICLGEGQNLRYFSKLNSENNWFNNIVALPHPRWIMQYRRKEVTSFIKLYVNTWKEAEQNLNLQ